jgi:hypothetical protein
MVTGLPADKVGERASVISVYLSHVLKTLWGHYATRDQTRWEHLV